MQLFKPSKKTEYYGVVGFFSIIIPLILYISRTVDDNRLTSWGWIFTSENVLLLFGVLLISPIFSFVISCTPELPKRLKPVFLLLVSYFAARYFWQAPEVILDTARYFTQAKQLALNGPGYFFSEWGKEIFAWTDLPLIPFLYGMVFSFFGEHRENIQLFTTLLYSGTVLLVYYWGKELWDENTGFYGGMFLLGFPYLYTQVPLMLVDVPTMFFFMLAVYLTTMAVRLGGWPRLLAAAFALFLSIFTKYSSLVFLPGLIVLFFVHLYSNPRQTLRRGLVLAATLISLVGLVLVFKFEVFAEQIRFLIQYQKPGLGRWVEGYHSTFFYQTHAFITLGALFSLYEAFRKRDITILCVCVFVIIIFVLQIKRIRYTMPVFPMLALMAAYGLKDIGDKEIRKFIVSCVIITSLGLAVSGYLPFLKKMSAVNIPNAVNFLESLDINQIEATTLPIDEQIVNPDVSIPLIDLFSSKQVVHKTGIDFSSPEGVETSSLRFTWEFQVPSLYYSPSIHPRPKRAVMVVSGKKNQLLPQELQKGLEDFNHMKSFQSSTGVFRYQTFVQVYYD